MLTYKTELLKLTQNKILEMDRVIPKYGNIHLYVYMFIYVYVAEGRFTCQE